MNIQNILIVDGDSVFRSSIKAFLENHNYKVCEATCVEDAVKHDLTGFFAVLADAVTADTRISDIINLSTGSPVIVTSAQASLRSAVEIMKMGAHDYLPKPCDLEELASLLATIGQQPDSGSQIEMLGECSIVKTLDQQIEKVALTDTNVLIEGESGTGKELVARKIHYISDRADRQMISLNCASIPDTQIESELFGHEAGAFPGATTSRQGLVEAADGSTLFLDEIGELPLDAQARLLRVLQQGEVRRAGSIDVQQVSVRLIASTHRNLQTLVATGEFREDLYYRINVVRLALPPLRERGDDLMLLAKHFLIKNAERHGKSRLKFNESAIRRINSYDWPGNIRELENAIQRAVILADGKTISADLLAVEHRVRGTFPTSEPEQDNVSLEDYFVKFVKDHQDQMTETELSQKLGISRKSLWQKRQRLGIPRERSKRL